MRLIIKLVKIFFVLTIVLLISAVVFINVFDANQYKPEISQQVEEATGRNFSIEGDIELTLYPWIGLRLTKVKLGNAEGFSQNDFAALEQLNVKINVLPLLANRVEINKIQLHGLKLSLEVNENATNNWHDLAGAEKNDAKSETQTTSSTGKASANPLESLHVDGIEFLGATISYTDKSTATQSKISNLDLNTSAIEFNTPVNLKFHARVEHNQPALDATIDLATSLTFNKEFSVFELQTLILSIAMKANDMLQQDLAATLETHAKVNLDSEIAEIKDFRLKAFDITSNAEIIIKDLLKTPAISGKLSIEKFNAVKLTKKLGITLPDMANKNALSSVGLSTNLKMQAQQLDLDAINIQFDDSNLSGWVHILDIAASKLRYDLVLNNINLDDYLPPEQPADTSTSTTAATATTASATTEPDKVAEDIVIELPLELLKQLDLEGVFAINTLHILDYDVSKISITTNARDGIIKLAPITLDVLDGKVNTELSLDVTKQLPAYAINMKISEIHADQVANPFLKLLSPEKAMQLRGVANITALIKTEGNSLNALKQAADGKTTLMMNKTEIDGFDPEYLLRSSVADYLQAKGLDSASIRSNYKPREVTAFDIISDTAILKDGKIQTSDFLMDSKRMTIKAKGFADIIQNSMDVTSSLQLKGGKTTAEKILDNPLSVRIHGPYAQLKFDIDSSTISNAISNQIKDKADALKEKIKAENQQKIEEEKQKLREKADAEKNKLKEKLKNKLKGLF